MAYRACSILIACGVAAIPLPPLPFVLANGARAACALRIMPGFAPPCRQVETQPYSRSWAQQGLKLSPDQLPCSASSTADRLAVTALQIAVFRVSGRSCGGSLQSREHVLCEPEPTVGTCLALQRNLPYSPRRMVAPSWPGQHRLLHFERGEAWPSSTFAPAQCLRRPRAHLPSFPACSAMTPWLGCCWKAVLGRSTRTCWMSSAPGPALCSPARWVAGQRTGPGRPRCSQSLHSWRKLCCSLAGSGQAGAGIQELLLVLLPPT